VTSIDKPQITLFFKSELWRQNDTSKFQSIFTPQILELLKRHFIDTSSITMLQFQPKHNDHSFVYIWNGTTQNIYNNFDLLLLHSDELRPPKQTDRQSIYLPIYECSYFMRKLHFLTPSLYFAAREVRRLRKLCQ
jgi:hypothetical protein